MTCRVGLVALLSIACGPAVVDDPVGGTGTDASSSASSDSATMSGSSTVGSASTDTTDPSGTATVMSSTGPVDTGSSDDGSCPPDQGEDDGPHFDVGPPRPECSLFEQDCREGNKCVPDGFWTRVCVPIDPDPVPDGESCSAVGPTDPCAVGSWCGPGDVCVPLCTGSFADPSCPAEMICVIDDEEVVAYCARPCDPFADDACPGLTCQPTEHGFGCLPSGGQGRAEPCQQTDSCSAGLVCVPGEEVPQCCSSSCCTPLCSAEHPCKGGACEPFDPAIPGPDGIGRCVL